MRLASFLLSMALCDSHPGSHWLSLPLSGILLPSLAHYCSLISRIQPLIGSQGPCLALSADATMTHFLPLCRTHIFAVDGTTVRHWSCKYRFTIDGHWLPLPSLLVWHDFFLQNIDWLMGPPDPFIAGAHHCSHRNTNTKTKFAAYHA